MFSVKNDTILDPFLGLGTTTIAAVTAGRNSIGFEVDKTLKDAVKSRTDTLIQTSNQRIRDRIKNHLDFVKSRFEEKGAFKYKNRHYQFPVTTNQETDLLINKVSTINIEQNIFEVNYSTTPQKEFQKNWDNFFISGKKKPSINNRKSKQIENVPVQLRIGK